MKRETTCHLIALGITIFVAGYIIITLDFDITESEPQGKSLEELRSVGDLAPFILAIVIVCSLVFLIYINKSKPKVKE